MTYVIGAEIFLPCAILIKMQQITDIFRVLPSIQAVAIKVFGLYDTDSLLHRIPVTFTNYFIIVVMNLLIIEIMTKKGFTFIQIMIAEKFSLLIKRKRFWVFALNFKADDVLCRF